MTALNTLVVSEIKKALSLPDEITDVKKVFEYLNHDARGTSEGGKSNFDHVKDYRYVYPSFKQLYNIDLNHEDITWWEYKMMLEGCLFNDCMLSRVIDIRTKKIPPKADQETKASISSLKHKYMLRQENNGLGSMFQSLKGVSKNGS